MTKKQHEIRKHAYMIEILRNTMIHKPECNGGLQSHVALLD